jgi:putative heme-binding domain-containing protein
MKTTCEMTIRLRRYLALLLLPALFCLLPAAFSNAQSSATQAQIEAGRQLYASTCGNSYCHGSEGKGGGGPKLRDRVFRAGYLRQIIRDGIEDTAMPGYKDRFSAEQINQLAAYLLSLSPGKGDSPEQALTRPAANPPSEHLNPPRNNPAAPPAPTNKQPSVNLAVTGVAPDNAAWALRGDARAGRELVFDAAQITNCRVCHSVNGIGGKVASDLNHLRELPPRQILQALLAPRNSNPEKYVAIALVTRSGEKYAGIKRDETDEALRLYDTSILPPISRNFLKSELASVQSLNSPSCPGGHAERYTLKQLLDLISFLKSADLKNSASVSLQELF